MSLLLDVKRGAQRPRVEHLPPGRATSAGAEAVELAASAGLILDDWQAWVLDEALAERTDGQWAAFECGLIVPRQNGKGSILEALELAALFLFEERLIVHSAHEFKTAREHFLRMQTLVRSSPELDAQVKYIHTGAGTESIGLRNGARLNFVARSRGSGRGFSGDRIVLDEAFNLPEQSIGAMLPALSARPNPQVWYTSSAPHADSHVLHALRRRGMSDHGGRLFFAEWGNDPEVDPDDLAALASANPALGIRISVEHCENEREAMRELGDEFVRERLGVPTAEDSTSGIFGPGVWPGLADPASKIDSRFALALDVAPRMAFASFGAAGFRHDGLAHIELVERAPGTGWVVAKAKTLTEKWRLPIWIDPRGPVAGMSKELRDAGIPVEELPDGQMTKACAALEEKARKGTIRHLGQRPLDDAVAGAAVRIVGDTWRWSRTSSKVDVSPLVAVTEALAVASEPSTGPAEYITLADV
jgi:phage terminase large subunit-like protein